MASVLRKLAKLRHGDTSPSGQPEGAQDEDSPEALAFEEECRMLIEMGFDHEQASGALRSSGGDMSEAVVALLGGRLDTEAALAAEQEPEAGAVAERDAGYSAEDLDAVLNEALKASEQEAEQERERMEEEQRNLDAALAASLESLSPTASQPENPSTNQEPTPTAGTHQERAAPEASATERRKSLNDREIADKVLGASSRRQQLDPARPLRLSGKEAKQLSPINRSPGQLGLCPPEFEATGSMSRSQRSQSLGQLTQSDLDTPSSSSHRSPHSQLPSLPSLVSNRGLQPDLSLRQQHRGMMPRSPHQDSRLPREDAAPMSSSTGGASSSGGGGSGTGEELVALEDLDGWSKGSGLFGVASIRTTYPTRLLPVSAPRQQAAPGMLQRRLSGQGLDARPGSRAGRQSLGSSSSSPLLAAGALQLS